MSVIIIIIIIISAILDFRGPVMGSLKSPCTTSYRSLIATIALNCLVFEKIASFAFWRQTDNQTNRQHRCTKPLCLAFASDGLISNFTLDRLTAVTRT